MKTILISVAFLIFHFGLSCQEKYDQRLLERYSEEQIIEFQKSSPQLLTYWTFFADNSFEIFEIPTEKRNLDLKEIEIDLNAFNVLGYDFSEYRMNGDYLKIKGTNKMLKLLSFEEFISLYNKQLKAEY